MLNQEIARKNKLLGRLISIFWVVLFFPPILLAQTQEGGVSLLEVALLPCTGKAGVTGHFRGELTQSIAAALQSLGLVRLVAGDAVQETIRVLGVSPSDYEKQGGIEVGKKVGAEEILVCSIEEHTDRDHYLVSLISRSVETGETKETGSGKIRKVYRPDQLQALSEEIVCEIRACERVQMFQRKRVLLVVDSSNSLRKMGGNDVFNRRRAGAQLIYRYIKRQKLSNVEFGVIDFSDRIHFALCPRSVFDHGDEIEAAIDRIGNEGGETNFDLCLREALKCLEPTTGIAENFVFFLTDGFHNTGIYQSTHQLFNPRTNPNLKAPIPINVMGLGADVGLNPESEEGLNAFVLSKIAQESGLKDFVPIYSADDIQAAFVSLVELEVMSRKGVASDMLEGVKKGKQKEFDFKGGGDIFIYIEEKSQFTYQIDDPRGNQIKISEDGSYRIEDGKGAEIPISEYPSVDVSMFDGQAVFIRIASAFHGDYRVGVTGRSGIPEEGTNLHYMVSTAEAMRLDLEAPQPGYVHENRGEDIHFRLRLAEVPGPIVALENRVMVYRNNTLLREMEFNHPPGVTTFDYVYSGTRKHGGGFYKFKFESKGELEGGLTFQRFRESNVFVPEEPTWLSPVLTAWVRKSYPQTGHVPEGLERVYFEFDTAEITKRTEDILAQLGGWLQSRPKVRIRLEGRCDDTGPEKYNLGLGGRRAKAVKDFLLSCFPDLDPSRIETISRGEEAPLIRNFRPAYQWVYRRVDIFIAESSQVSHQQR